MEVEADEVLTPTFIHARNLYLEMEKGSELVDPSELVALGWPPHATDSVRIFEGNIKDAATRIGLSTHMRYRAAKMLSLLSATTKLRHGGNTLPSIYVLNFVPTKEMYDVIRGNSRNSISRMPPSKIQLLTNEINRLSIHLQDLERRLAVLERRK